jgi:transposase
LLFISRTLAGDHFFVTAPQVNTLYFEYVLQEFSCHEPEVFKIILLLGKPGYHRVKALKEPENIRLLYLPSSNPELKPVERFWQDMKGKVAFQNFKGESELEDWIKSTATAYQNEQIASLIGFKFILEVMGKAIATMEGT